MSKYEKGDCRSNAGIKNKAYSRMKWVAVFTGQNRKQRRGIGARFRAAYGKAAYIEMIEKSKKSSLLSVIKEYVGDDKNAYKKIVWGQI